MKCNGCGAENRNDSKFCKSCGDKIGKTEIIPSDSSSKKGFTKWILGGSGLLVVAAAMAFLLLTPGGAKTVHAKNGEVRIALSDVSDGKAHFFEYQTGGKVTRFFLLKAPDGQVRAALDACDVCFQAKKGYRQEGDVMICNNCNNRFPADKINAVSGGCNPVSLDRRIEGNEMILSEAQLASLVTYF